MAAVAPSDRLTAPDKRHIKELKTTFDAVRTELRKRVVGMDAIVEQVLIGVFANGHSLLIGVPGLAKTLLIRSLADIFGLDFRRIQFTPDLMPSDITGTHIITSDPDTDERVFQFTRGPIFAHLILADEINRTPPKTQSALIEAMEEQQVTSSGQRFVLESPFFVLATQNPIEQEGTYPLPVAQLDRFMFTIKVDYPSWEEERRIIEMTTSAYTSQLKQLLGREDILRLQALVRRVEVPEKVLKYATRLVRSTRLKGEGAAPFTEWLDWGCGPRAGHYLLLGGKTRAMLQGRTNVTAEDVRRVAVPVLRHRIILSYHAEAEGVTPEAIVEELLAEVPAPDGGHKRVGQRSSSFFTRWLGRG